MKIIQLLGLYPILLLTGCNRNNNTFPEDLMYKGEPIHPWCIMQTQDGDSSHLQPQKIYTIKDSDYLSPREDLNYYKEISKEIRFDPKTKIVAQKLVYTLVDDEPIKSNVQYQWIGSYKGKHIIKTKSYSSSRGITAKTLGTIKRIGDTIQNVNDIAYDAYEQGIKIHSLSENILRFSKKFTLERALEIITDSFDVPEVYYYPVSLIYEVDLDGTVPYKAKPAGLMLPRTPEDIASLNSNENTKVREILHRSTQSGKKELNLEEAKKFAQEIITILS